MTTREHNPLVAVHDLHKSYSLPESSHLTVLSGAHFSLATGTTLAVTGQSGSGKSTLIALLAGLDRPDQGRITMNGADLTAMDEAGLTRFRAAHIGIVFQQFHLLPHLSAEENIRLPLELLDRPCEEATIDALLESVGFSGAQKPSARPAQRRRMPASGHCPGPGGQTAAPPGRRAHRQS